MSKLHSDTFFFQARKVKKEFGKKIDLYATVILNYAPITYYWFPITTKHDVHF